MQAQDIICILLEGKSSNSMVPLGIKNNVYMLLDNTLNSQKRSNGKPSRFDDACGAWSSNGSTKKYHYVKKDGIFKYLEVKD